MENLILVKNLNQLKDLVEYTKKQEGVIAFDTETTGTTKNDTIVGLSLCAEFETAYYVCLQEWNVKSESLNDFETVKEINSLLVELLNKNLIMHNGVFDCAMVERNFNVSLINSLHTDTLPLSHLLDENRLTHKLKDLGADIFGEDSLVEQREMKESVVKNGGIWQEGKDGIKEMYKADTDVLGRYGAKDTILTFKLFYHLLPQLIEQGLDKFFYEEESMPLLRGPTYELNTVGLKVDADKLSALRGSLEAECAELRASIYHETFDLVKDKYPGTRKNNIFNFNSGIQLSWLLFDRLKNSFGTLTDTGKEMCHKLGIGLPYAPKDKKKFIEHCTNNLGVIWRQPGYNPKTKKNNKLPAKILEFWKYTQTDEDNLEPFRLRYSWVDKLLKLKKNEKLLSVYVLGIQEKLRYNVISPSFLQHGTTSGRYSSKAPNFQNLPPNKKLKSCIISRPGKVLIGADYSQLEPRVFASVSQDPTLMECFEKGQDFYALVGMPMFNIEDCSPYKGQEDSFEKMYPAERKIAKAFALASAYGTGASRQAQETGLPKEECQRIIERYFESYPKVELMMLESHQMAKRDGVVYSLYGRPRRMPEAKEINEIYGNIDHSRLPYEARTILNLGMNHRVQSSAASIVNRAMIAFYNAIQELNIQECHIVMQVHDEIIVECKEEDKDTVHKLLKYCMEETTVLPGVRLVAEPKIANNLADLK